MPRYQIAELAEGYTLIKTEGRFYPMTISFKEDSGILVPEVSPIIVDEKVVSYTKRSTAANYTYRHKAMMSHHRQDPPLPVQ